MNAVLISIQPKWCEKIANGEKVVEVRKSRPRLETPFKCYIYCTNGKDLLREVPCYYKTKLKETLYRIINQDYNKNPIANGKVIGEFICDRIEDFSKWEFDYPSLLRHINLFAGTNGDYKFLDYYLKGQKKGYGWHISDLKTYDKPKELSEFKKQNFCYRSGDWEKLGCWEGGCVRQELGECDGRCSVVERPPQSWCYVEELQNG